MKDFFPALYNIAQDQQARVADYLSWPNEEMVWSVILLRASQDWEMEDFTAFLDILYTQKVNRVDEDHLSWDHTKSGRFEVSITGSLVLVALQLSLGRVRGKYSPSQGCFLYMAGCPWVKPHDR